MFFVRKWQWLPMLLADLCHECLAGPAGAMHNLSEVLPMLYRYFLININILEKNIGLFAEVICRSSAMPAFAGSERGAIDIASRPTAGPWPPNAQTPPF
jgi:hypothetical protein